MPDIAGTLEVSAYRDLLVVGRWARRIGAALHLDPREQLRLAVAVSEIAGNAIRHGGGGRVEFLVAPELLVVRVCDAGPGISDIPALLEGGLGRGGISAARNLSDHFDIESAPGRGTTVVMGKRLLRPADPAAVARLFEALARDEAPDLAVELEQWQRDLLEAHAELHRRELEISRLSRELEETNRGVVALYAELDERALELGRAADLKSRVLADISHEVRTPLNAVLNVTRLLLDRVDGDLTPEQERQVRLIRDSTTSLTDLVTDLLELARMEAGKAVARISEFSVDELFASLRGMFRPLISSDAVVLTVEEAPHLPHLNTDEGKVGQILRNLISNALKFTSRGKVRVSARLEGGESIAFTVSDTGRGIAAEDQERIFQEYVQVEAPGQPGAYGAGLGLTLSRRLAGFLGGSLTVTSELGVGSTFTAVIPCRYLERRSSERREPPEHPRSGRSPFTESSSV